MEAKAGLEETGMTAGSLYASHKDLPLGHNDKPGRQAHMVRLLCLFDLWPTFHSDLIDPGKLLREFATHKEQHPATTDK